MNLFRKFCVAALSVTAFAVIGAATAFITLTTAETEETVLYSMGQGASVRFGNSGNGLRFSFNISAEAYESNNEYTKYGILIAPEDYLTEGKELTLANVFGVGGTAIYNWAVKNSDGEWTYRAEEGKTRIMNIEAEAFADQTARIDGQEVALKTFYASIINVNEANLAREFRAVGYVASSDDGEAYTYRIVDYAMTGSENGDYTYEALTEGENVRSIAYVAQRAIEDSSSKLTPDQKAWLQANYVDKVSSQTTTYTVEHYVEQEDGSFALKNDATDACDALIAAKASAERKVFEDYVYDADNVNNMTSGTVYANGKLTLKLYYRYKDRGLIDVSEESEIVIPSFANYTAVKLYRTQTNTASTLYEEVEELTNKTLSLSGLSGTYAVKATASDGSEETILTFDAYDSAKLLEWSSVGELSCVLKENGGTGGIEGGIVDTASEGVADDRTGNYYKIKKAINTTTTNAIFTLLPIHGKAYYDLYADEMSKYTLSYDIYASATDGLDDAGNSVTITKVGGSIARDGGYNYNESGKYHYFGGVQINNKAWTTYTITLDKLYVNWDKYTSSDPSMCIYYMSNVFYFSNTNTKIAAGIWYIGNLRLSVAMDCVTITEQLVDVKGCSEYDLTSLMTDEAKQTFRNNLRYGEVVWTLTNTAGASITLTDTSIVKFDDIAARYYTLEAKIGETVICTGSVDFYDSDVLQWTEAENGSYSVGGKGSVEIVSNPYGRTGCYYKYTTGDARGWVNLKPIHSTAYYTNFAADKVFSVDVYVVVNDTDVAALKTVVFETGKQNATQIGTWNAYTATADYMSGIFNNPDSNAVGQSFVDYAAWLQKNNNSTWSADYSVQVEIYFGNIRLVDKLVDKE